MMGLKKTKAKKILKIIQGYFLKTENTYLKSILQYT